LHPSAEKKKKNMIVRPTIQERRDRPEYFEKKKTVTFQSKRSKKESLELGEKAGDQWPRRNLGEKRG